MEGLTSRWTRPFACAASRAFATWLQMASARAGSSAPSARRSALQVRSLDEAHREVEAAVDVARVVDRHDVRVLERHGELRLAREALAEALVERQLGRHQLQRDRPLQPQVVGAVDDAHPTAADQLVDPIADELGADPDLCLSGHGISRPPGSSLRRSPAAIKQRSTPALRHR